MKAPFTRLFVHMVWATWDRTPLITPEVERVVYSCIQAECSDLKAEMVEIGGTEDHVHLLVRIPTTVTIAQLAKQVKGSSSHLVTHTLPGVESFKWQGCYGAFTVSPWDVAKIQRYIQNQRQHHTDGSTHADLEAVWIEAE